MSVETIRATIIELLNQEAYFGPGVAAATYAVLEQRPISIVVSWSRLSNTIESFGKRRLIWTMTLEVWIKDEGDPNLVLERLHTTVDTLNHFVIDNQPLAEVAEMVLEMRANHRPGEAQTVGTAALLPYTVELDVLEWN